MENGVTAFLAAASADLAADAATRIGEDELRQVLTAAMRLYAQRAEQAGRCPAPIGAEATATEVLTLACEMIRSADLNMFDVSMWFQRTR